LIFVPSTLVTLHLGLSSSVPPQCEFEIDGSGPLNLGLTLCSSPSSPSVVLIPHPAFDLNSDGFAMLRIGRLKKTITAFCAQGRCDGRSGWDLLGEFSARSAGSFQRVPRRNRCRNFLEPQIRPAVGSVGCMGAEWGLCGGCWLDPIRRRSVGGNRNNDNFPFLNFDFSCMFYACNNACML
jgi:hypothetical protein